MAGTELSNIEITIYALYRLRGYERKVHTEEIAYESYQLAKDRFGWKLSQFRAKGFPDKDVVRVALTDAVKDTRYCSRSGRACRRADMEARISPVCWSRVLSPALIVFADTKLSVTAQ
jgi:hypothetical protein